MSGNLAYFLGALHSDGGLYRFYHKKEHRVVHRLRFEVGEKSLPMLSKVQEIVEKEFRRKVKILSLGVNEYGTKMYLFEVWINRLLPIFAKLEITTEKIPSWIMNDGKQFLTYLAGLIDGDGTIFITRRAHPQCRIRIYSNKRQPILVNLIKRYLNCKPWIEVNTGSTPKGKITKIFYHTFLLSSKNKKIFRELCLPFIQVKHKKNRVLNFLK